MIMKLFRTIAMLGLGLLVRKLMKPAAKRSVRPTSGIAAPH
jgi:hypothetical protein